MRIAAPAVDALPSLVGLLINDQRFGEDACYVYARLSDNTFLLVNDNGVGTKPLGSLDSVANKQCEVVRDGSSIVRSDNGFVVSAHVRFKPAFSGYQRLFLISYDQNQATDGLKPAGDWQIPTASVR